MIGFTFDDDKNIADWVSSKIEGHREFPQPFTAIGVTYMGVAFAGFVFNGYRTHTIKNRTRSSIEVSMASIHPVWCQRSVIKTILRYPFVQLGVNRLNALVSRKNMRARKLLKGLGFKEEGIIRQWYADADGAVYGMVRHEAARWLGELDEQGHAESARRA